MKKINLYNRYGYDVYLLFKNKDSAILKFEQTCRVGIIDENSCYMVDPSGGPIIMVGQELEIEGVIKKITSIKRENEQLIINFDENDISEF